MEIRYSKHLLLRLNIRGIPEELPRFVYGKARRRFLDAETGLRIAIMRVRLYGKMRHIAVSYRPYGDTILLVTIHPLKAHQLENRITSGRWKEIKL